MFDKNRFSTGEFLSDQPVSAPVSEPVSVPAWHTNTNYSLDFRNYLKKIYGNNELKDVVLNSLAETWKKNPSQIITTANEKTKAANAKALQEQRAAEERRRNARSQWNQDNAKYAVKVEPKEESEPSNDFSNVANFNEAFRQASKAGLKTFVWKKTKGNPSGLFSTEVASKQSNTEKPKVAAKEKKKTEDAQSQVQKDYAFDGSRINIEKFPYVNEDRGYSEFGHNAYLQVDPSRNSRLPYLYPWDTTVSSPYSWLQWDFPVDQEPTEEHNTEWARGYLKASDYFGRKGMYKKGGIMNKVQYFAGGGQPQAQNGQADAFMKAVLNGDPKAIGQLVQAANQGNAEATQLIQTILQEEQKGNAQVAKAASVIKQLANGAVSAKWGSKLQYMRSLKYAKGGKAKSCPVCDQQKVEMKKCGGKKAKKHYFGGWL